MGMGRTREEAQRRRGGNREDRECGTVESAFCNCLGQRVAYKPQNPLEKGLDQSMDLPIPMAWSKTPPRLCASARESPDGEGEDSRRGAEAQRGGIGRTGNAELLSMLSATALDSGQQITPKTPSKKVRIRAWTYPPPWSGRKRHRALCGRSLRMEMERSGWKSGDLFGRPLATLGRFERT